MKFKFQLSNLNTDEVIGETCTLTSKIIEAFLVSFPNYTVDDLGIEILENIISSSYDDGDKEL